MVLALIDGACRSGVPQKRACWALGLSVRTVQRWRKQGEDTGDRRSSPRAPRRPNPNALSEVERQIVLETLNSPSHREMTPHQVVVRLADQGRFLASESTMYRLLRSENQLAHRALSTAPQPRVAPRLVARGPNQVWSWDITYLLTTVKGRFFYLYLLEDIWSRRIMGAAVHDQQLESHAVDLFRGACADASVETASLTSHSDNGSPMKGATLAATLRRMGITMSFSRPRVSNDNPYSEALFRTLKYQVRLPLGPFESLPCANDWVERFVHWYNTEHLHSAIRYLTPDQRHHGLGPQILSRRRRVYERARARNPKRWTGPTRNWTPVKDVSINPE